jgi:anti-sigma factor RsiW
MNDTDIRRMVASSATRYEAPPQLSRSIKGKLREREPGVAPSTGKPANGWRNWSYLAGAFACGLVVAWISASLMQMNEASNRVIEEAVSDHVRSMMVAHLTDVESSDQHTVKPWFNGKLTYSPPIRDLSAQGFQLSGGRLDYLDGRSVAALVYRHRLHIINVFVMPCQASAINSRASSREGFNVVGWCDTGVQYLAVSDLNAEELWRFAELLSGKD